MAILSADCEIIRLHGRRGARISGSDMRDMMLEAAEKLFGIVRAPQPSERQSDNDSPYTAKETRDFTASLNLVPRFTPLRSPESNGMLKAFVKAFKRDDLCMNPLPHARPGVRQISGWIDDGTGILPHSTLPMRSVREFVRAQTQ